jgi:hypothetical protein
MPKKRGEIKPNSRCWLKPFDKPPQLPTHEARENPEHFLAHAFGVALRDTGPVHVLKCATHQGHVRSANRRAIGQGTAPLTLKADGLDPLPAPPP